MYIFVQGELSKLSYFLLHRVLRKDINKLDEVVRRSHLSTFSVVCSVFRCLIS